MWKRILVPHDFSRCAQRAVEVAVELVEPSCGQLTLFHVSPLPPNLPLEAAVTAPGRTLPTSVDEMVSLGARRELSAIADAVGSKRIRVDAVAIATTRESPAVAILRVADELAVDAIVLGTHGRTGIARMLLGSVAEQVVRGASVPVVTVRSHDDELHLTEEEIAAEDELAG